MSQNAHPLAILQLLIGDIVESVGSMARTIVVALFLLTFVLQPFLIPSESMERTLLVGDFLLLNRQVFAPSALIDRWTEPQRKVERGDIVVFRREQGNYIVKRVVGMPGDRIRVDEGRVVLNGKPLNEPYAAFEPAELNAFREHFPARVYSDPQVDLDWWRQMQLLVVNGELQVPADKYFVLGDNRNHSIDSRFWGFVNREQIIGRPLVIYFSLTRPSTTDLEQAADDRLGHDRELGGRFTGFARWKRIFRIVH